MDTKEYNVLLTDYGFIAFSDIEYSIYKFKEYFEKNMNSVQDFTYDEVNMQFTLVVDYDKKKYEYTINLANDHKRLLAEGKADEDVLILMNCVKKIHREKRKKEIVKTTRTTGDSPTSVEDIRLYAEYLQEQLKETKAHVVTACRILSIPAILVCLSKLGFNIAGMMDSNNHFFLAVLLYMASFVGFLFSFLSFGVLYIKYEDGPLGPIYLKNSYNEYKDQYLKLAKFRLKCEQLGLLKKGQSFKNLPAAEEDDFTYEVPSTIKM
jgi:hypothetical protein